MAEKYYRDTVWTTHALQRLADRRIPQHLVYKAIVSADEKRNYADGSVEYSKRFGIYKITAIVKQNNLHQKVIISCWMNPPLKGTEDAEKKQRYYRYKNGNLAVKLWLIVQRRFFGKNF